MRIVTDGVHFAIEKGWIFKKYLSLICLDNWWGVNDICFQHCWGSREYVDKTWISLHRKRNIRPVLDTQVGPK